jgi:putative endonuclease
VSDWSLYLIRCADGSLYAGIATDVERRLEEHRAGGPRGAKYLRGRGPLELVLRVAIGPRSLATKVERRVKKLRKTDKERLLEEPCLIEEIVDGCR